MYIGKRRYRNSTTSERKEHMKEELLKQLEEIVLKLGAKVEIDEDKQYYTLDTDLIKGKKIFYFNT
jgi:hypothetical protein